MADIRQRRVPPSTRPPDDSIRDPANPQNEPHATFKLDSSLTFLIFFLSHIVAALYSPIQDCDEVFNYWEPTHYLNHGHGFQTWEYSPVYAIRSWAYAAMHALGTAPGAIFGYGKAAEFYLLRFALGFVCAMCEQRLFSKIAATLNPRIAIIFLVVMATSPGMFHASVAYLPSSFSMYTTMLGIAEFMDWRGGRLRTAQGIFAIGAGAVLGWPFGVLMSVPFLLEELLFAIIGDAKGILDLVCRVFDGSLRTLVVLAFQIAIDAFFYRKLVAVPFNIVWYNVFAGKGGPDLYGTEPWHFYFRNLFLNFHVWFALALSAMPLLLFQHFGRARPVFKASYLRGIVFLSPFYLWLLVFSLQPHKEERFMYPTYPCLALNAAMSSYIILAQFGSTSPKDLAAKIPIQLRLICLLGFVFGALGISVFRTVGTMTAYNAPLMIYKPLHHPHAVRPGDILCLGKEWYRFPSHYFLPKDMHAKFIKSEFSGLLPGEFNETQPGEGFGMFPGAWLKPKGMNDMNQEDIGKYTDLKHCNFLVDSQMPSTVVTRLEPSYMADTENWERIKCLPFLDAASTGFLGRMGWVPDWPGIPKKFRRVYGEYCLLKRRKRVAGTKVDAAPHIETLG